MDTLLTVVDVGARGKPTVPVRKLEPVRLVAIEPDEDEAKRLAESLARYSLAHVDVLPVALGNGGPAVLHVARSGGYSSFYRPTDTLARFKPGSEIVAEIEMQTVTLDDAAAAHHFEDAAILKLDTQGSELDILRHGQRVLAAAVALSIEVAFRPIYEDAPLFAEVDSFLRESGFAIYDLKRGRLRPARSGEHPSEPQLLWGHALYLREAEKLDELRRDHLFRIAVAYGQLDIASELARSDAMRAIVQARARRLKVAATRWKD